MTFSIARPDPAVMKFGIVKRIGVRFSTIGSPFLQARLIA